MRELLYHIRWQNITLIARVNVLKIGLCPETEIRALKLVNVKKTG
jgi:hypothetical protein